MKSYSPNGKVPMKFHNLYVWILNPLAILALAAIAALVLLTAININVAPEVQQRIDGNQAEHAQLLLWIMFGFLGLGLLFQIISEVLLAKRRALGVLILIFGYLLNTAGSVATAINEPSTSNYIALAITALISLLVCVYYWKRRRLIR